MAIILGRPSMDKKYGIIIFWSSEDNAFIAVVPELPGCMADGKTYQEALGNEEKIIEEWIETATKLIDPSLSLRAVLHMRDLAL